MRFIILSILFLAAALPLCAKEPTPTKIDEVKLKEPLELAKFDFRLPLNGELPLLPFVMEEETSVADDLLSLANSYLGLRYRRGGKTPKGFDCSGFTSYIFSQFGYELLSNSAAQFSQGVAIDKNEVKPGDLLFFNGRAIGKRIGHVGIAVEQNPVTGEITFIHSAVGGGIRIDKTTSPYYARRFVGVRRIL